MFLKGVFEIIFVFVADTTLISDFILTPMDGCTKSKHYHCSNSLSAGCFFFPTKIFHNVELSIYLKNASSMMGHHMYVKGKKSFFSCECTILSVFNAVFLMQCTFSAVTSILQIITNTLKTSNNIYKKHFSKVEGCTASAHDYRAAIQIQVICFTCSLACALGKKI